MKESNNLADNAENISLGRDLWLNTKGEYTKEYKMLLYKIKPINIKIRFVSKYAQIQVWDILVIIIYTYISKKNSDIGVLRYPMLVSTILVYQSGAELRQAQGKLQLARLLVFSLFNWHCSICFVKHW